MSITRNTIITTRQNAGRLLNERERPKQRHTVGLAARQGGSRVEVVQYWYKALAVVAMDDILTV